MGLAVATFLQLMLDRFDQLEQQMIEFRNSLCMQSDYQNDFTKWKTNFDVAADRQYRSLKKLCIEVQSIENKLDALLEIEKRTSERVEDFLQRLGAVEEQLRTPRRRRRSSTNRMRTRS